GPRCNSTRPASPPLPLRPPGDGGGRAAGAPVPGAIHGAGVSTWRHGPYRHPPLRRPVFLHYRHQCVGQTDTRLCQRQPPPAAQQHNRDYRHIVARVDMGIFERLVLVIGLGRGQVAVHNFWGHARFKTPPAKVFALVELKQALHLVPSAPLQDAQHTEVLDIAYAVLALALDHCAKHLVENQRNGLLEVGRFLPPTICLHRHIASTFSSSFNSPLRIRTCFCVSSKGSASCSSTNFLSLSTSLSTNSNHIRIVSTLVFRQVLRRMRRLLISRYQGVVNQPP